MEVLQVESFSSISSIRMDKYGELFLLAYVTRPRPNAYHTKSARNIDKPTFPYRCRYKFIGTYGIDPLLLVHVPWCAYAAYLFIGIEPNATS